MTSKQLTPTIAVHTPERFPDFPPRDDMQNTIHLADPSLQATLRIHFGNSETTLVLGEVPVSWSVGRVGVRIPDLMVAFGVDRPGIVESNGYAIDLVGKPPDFALEVASPTTGMRDYTAKRRDYERFGVVEYWRFDHTGGDWHDAALAGDRLVDGRYQPIEVEWPERERGRGYSRVLGLYLCWEEGSLRFYDPQRGRYLPTLDNAIDDRDREADRADHEASRADHEAERADRESERADRESERADRAEEENRRLNQLLRDLGHADE